MSDKMKNIHDDLSDCMRMVDRVCRHYNYDMIPTLVLRHEKGASYSIMLGNDDSNKVIQTIQGLETSGRVN